MKMKGRLLFLSLALVLVVAMLIPAAVLADSGRPSTVPVTKRFSVVLTPTSIDDTVIGTAWPNRDTASTDVWPILDSTGIVGWIIDGRSIRGGLSGDINGGFSFTYGGVLDVLQSGSIQGVVTLKAGASPLDVIHMAANGDLQAEVKAAYTFAEIQGWCAAANIPVGYFFSLIYNAPGLAAPLIPEAFLGMAYGASAPLPLPYPPLPPLPLLPKTLTADFSGTVRIDAGTGAYGGSRGTGQFASGKQLLTLNVYPNQHVYKIDGQIKMTGTYSKQTPREIGKIDRDKLKDAIDKFKGNSDK